jgi:tRNA 2-thiouridine synthesizing protein B
MTCLHTISKSPASKLLSTCASVLNPGDGILFIEDGVYYCSLPESGRHRSSDIRLFGLKEDAAARGLSVRSAADVELVDYAGFVELCCKYDKIVSWF